MWWRLLVLRYNKQNGQIHHVPHILVLFSLLSHTDCLKKPPKVGNCLMLKSQSSSICSTDRIRRGGGFGERSGSGFNLVAYRALIGEICFCNRIAKGREISSTRPGSFSSRNVTENFPSCHSPPSSSLFIQDLSTLCLSHSPSTLAYVHFFEKEKKKNVTQIEIEPMISLDKCLHLLIYRYITLSNVDLPEVSGWIGIGRELDEVATGKGVVGRGGFGSMIRRGATLSQGRI